MKFISKHRVKDYADDCYYEEDEYENVNSTIINALILTDRFRCIEKNEWLPRPLALDLDCIAAYRKLGLGVCETASDNACQYLRGSYSPSIYYIFRENCNNFVALDFLVENETDETNCEEW
ncbi:hypothetical protein I4U23_027410 [Adineta vaga]|nr:hypothetical protein I4U23_027410 [Adineta vaga]